MLTLVNANTMTPPIAPVGLDYIAGAAKKAGIQVDIVDLCLTDNPDTLLQSYFASHNPDLAGISFRNVDDCFWPSAQWFVPQLVDTVNKIRNLTDASVVLGGVGFSIFGRRIVEYAGADFGILGDGEQAMICLLKELQGAKYFENVDGLIWRKGEVFCSNRPAWPRQLSLPTERNSVDNKTYFKLGGQGGIETKRGCNRHCIYCADPLAKGAALRLRKPAEVADEVENLLSQGIDVLHLCDGEFNIPGHHAYRVCEEFIRRRFGQRLRWYTYMSIVPFDKELAAAMKRAGCVGIDFTTDSASPVMLKTYGQRYLPKDIAFAVRLCKENGVTVMLDLLLGGPGETPETAAETISFIKEIGPDCAGAPLGVRIYPGTKIAQIVAAEGDLEKNPNIRRNYEGEVDFFKPTFYISSLLGDRPARLVKDLIDGDRRFFEPMEESAAADKTDHNYNANMELAEAIRKGARGAYWDILRRIKIKA